MGQVKTVCFFDCDGTLVPHVYKVLTFAQTVSPRVCDAVREFVDAGNLAFLSTARVPSAVNEHIRALPFAGMVCVDGCYVERDGQVVLDVAFDEAVVDEMLEECFAYGLAGLFDARGGSFVVGDCKLDVVGDLPRYDSVQAVHDARPDLHVWKMSFSDADFAQLARHSHVLDRCEHYSAGMGAHELTSLGVGKGSGARRLLATVEGVPQHVMAFGDAGNDIPVFEMCDVTVAMGNADDAAKDRATYVTADVDHDGVAEGLAALRQYWA